MNVFQKEYITSKKVKTIEMIFLFCMPAVSRIFLRRLTGGGFLMIGYCFL